MVKPLKQLFDVLRLCCDAPFLYDKVKCVKCDSLIWTLVSNAFHVVKSLFEIVVVSLDTIDKASFKGGIVGSLDEAHLLHHGYFWLN